MGNPSQPVPVTVPTICFNFEGKNYSVIRVDETRGVVHACRFHFGRRMRGRPRIVSIADMGPTTIRRISRKGK